MGAQPQGGGGGRRMRRGAGGARGMRQGGVGAGPMGGPRRGGGGGVTSGGRTGRPRGDIESRITRRREPTTPEQESRRSQNLQILDAMKARRGSGSEGRTPVGRYVPPAGSGRNFRRITRGETGRNGGRQPIRQGGGQGERSGSLLHRGMAKKSAKGEELKSKAQKLRSDRQAKQVRYEAHKKRTQNTVKDF